MLYLISNINILLVLALTTRTRASDDCILTPSYYVNEIA